MAVNTPEQGWVVLPALSSSFSALKPEAADEAALSFVSATDPFWKYIGQAQVDNSSITWSLAGTLPEWRGTPLVFVLALEDNDPRLAQSITTRLLTEALNQ
jgi:hypothetical protein